MNNPLSVNNDGFYTATLKEGRFSLCNGKSFKLESSILKPDRQEGQPVQVILLRKIGSI